MKVLYSDNSKSLVFNPETDFRTNLGWEENFLDQQNEILRSIINPIENYETVRHIHEQYNSTISGTTISQCDIWFYFYFLNNQNPKTYANGLDYNFVGIAPKENALLLKHTTNSFFRLEFYTTKKRETQKLVFAKNLSIPLGQKVYDINLRDTIFVPVFHGNNYRNTENMYLFWFNDDTVYSEYNKSSTADTHTDYNNLNSGYTFLHITSGTTENPIQGTLWTRTGSTGNWSSRSWDGPTFYMTARFFNAEDGTITRFLNKDLTANNSGLVNGTRMGTLASPLVFYEMNYSNPLNDENDSYYKITFKRANNSYKIIREVP